MLQSNHKHSLPSSAELPDTDNLPVDNELHTLVPNFLRFILSFIWNKRNDWFFGVNMGLSYVVWEEKEIVPQFVLEVVSETPSNEYEEKMNIYARLGVLYYLIYRGFGFPRFKKKIKSFLYPSVKQDWVGNNWVKLPKIGKVKIRMSRPTPDSFLLKQIRVVRRASGYFVQLIYQLAVNVPDVPIYGHPLGIDIGLDCYLATSDGELVKRPRFFNQLHGKLTSLQRRLKNKKKGSNNWQKLQGKIARLYQKIHETRKDWQFKLAHHLCDQAGMIFVEDINFKAWAKGLFGKHTLDAGFGELFNILSYVCWKRDVFFLKVDKDYTSQICPNCNTHTGKKNLSNRIHKCPSCGYQTNRDVAASQVIRNRGLNAVGQPVLEIASGGVLSGLFFEQLDKS